MTAENRLFITLDEITGLRFECAHCHAKLTILMNNAFPSSLLTCMNCRKPWFEGEHDSRVKVIGLFVTAFNQLKQLELKPPVDLEISNSVVFDHASNGKD